MPDQPPWDGRPSDPETSGYHWVESQITGQRFIAYWRANWCNWFRPGSGEDVNSSNAAIYWRYLGPVNPVPLGMEKADG